MEPKKKLKVIPMWQFFTDMKLVDKLLFSILFLTLVGTAVVAVMASENPVRWAIDVNEVSESQPEQVTLRSYTHNYRTLETQIGAWKEQVTYYATRITPQPWLVLGFILAQILGWAYLLASASYVRNFVAYIVFLAFGILIFVANAVNADNSLTTWLINGGLAVLLLVPAYLLQQEIWKPAFALRLLIFAVITALPFAIQYYTGGWVQLHSASVGMMPVLAVVAVVYLVFVSNDLNNLIFYLATNAKNPKYRLKLPIIFTLFLVLTALEFAMLQKSMGWNLLAEGNEIALRPMMLIAAASIITVGTKQALGPVLKPYIPTQGMSMGLVAIPLIGLSFIAYLVGTGEYLFLHMIERIAISLMFFSGIAHFFYMLYNFGPLIRNRINFYYLSMMPRKLMYFFVIALAIAGAGILEATSLASSKRLFAETMYNRLGDNELLLGNSAEAMIHYRTSVEEARGSVKGNYNLAMLELAASQDFNKVREHLRRASDFIPFSYAYLNWGALEQSDYSPVSAKTVLLEGSRRVPNAFISSNLAQAYLSLDEPDSAILQLKQAMRLEPENGALYANMGRLYLAYEKPEEAKKFLEAGLALPHPHRAVITNALFMNMRYGTQLDVPASLLQADNVKDSWETIFNFALERYKVGDLQAAAERLAHGNVPDPLDDSTSRSLRADSLLLDGMLLFEHGEIERAISRMEYIDVNFPEYRPYTNHFLGTAFFGAGSPEMAAAFFRKSVDGGRTSDLLSEAMMEFDRGNLDYAFLQLNLARATDSTLSADVNREMTKLQLANGDYFFATIGFDPGTLAVGDWMQIGHAAGQRGNKAAALEAFSRVLVKEPKNIAPYLEMAKISLALGDTLAMDNLRPALEIAPKDIALNVVHARILMQAADLAGATRIADDLKARAATDRDVRILLAEFSAAKSDTTTAIAELEKLRKENPIAPDVILPLSRIYRAKRMDFEGQNMLMAAKDINPENPDFWYELAHFERLLVRPEESGANALEAMKRATSLERSKQIAEEFKEEITSFRTMHPAEEEEIQDNGN
jgi:tetratricopeptide (TPR) repeat protein